MKKCYLFIPLLLFCLAGCAQNEQRRGYLPGKIPIDASRWYQLTNASNGLDELFDGDCQQKPNTGYNKLVPHYESWYPLKEGETMRIDSLKWYCYRTIDAPHPVTLYVIDSNWKRIEIGKFTGKQAATWYGPEADKANHFAFANPISGFRYLVLDSWGEFPAELELYGKYMPPSATAKLKTTSTKLSNLFGINAFEWDFEDPKNPMVLDAARLKPMSNFTGFRHYLDWGQLEPEQGRYTFAPVRNGGWNYDTLYRWCQDERIEVLACLKTIPKWMQESYPEGKRNAENIPARYGAEITKPSAYVEHGRVAFQFAARYGGNSKLDLELVRVDTTSRWKGDVVNKKRIGLGLVKYVECDNERDKWWKGRQAYQTAREYAANLSAFYDGHKGTMGPGVGVKNADPNMLVVMGGLANPDPGYLMGMIDWCREFRGYRPDGSINLAWDVINYHFYCNDANDAPGKEQTEGRPPEATIAGKTAARVVELAAEYAPGMPVWITEAGYDIHPQSPQGVRQQGSKSTVEVQGDWILRTSLLYEKMGIGKLFFYQLYDDNAGSSTRYATSGLINADKTNRPAADCLRQVNELFGSYSYQATIMSNPIVDRYGDEQNSMVAVYAAEKSSEGKAVDVEIGADTALIYHPAWGKEHMSVEKRATANGKVRVIAGGTPIFLVGRAHKR